MNGTPRVSAPPHRQSAPSAAYHADRAQISLPGKFPRPIVAWITRPSGEFRLNHAIHPGVRTRRAGMA
jgi:hypothetical protein